MKKCTVGKSLSNGIKEGMAMQKKDRHQSYVTVPQQF